MSRNGNRQSPASTSGAATASRTAPTTGPESEACEWDEPSTWSHYVEDNPTTSVLVSLGVGFGVGMLVGSLLQGPVRRWTHTDDRNFAERMGRRVMSSLRDVVPSNLFGKG